MKKYWKILSVILAVLLLVTSCFALISCKPKDGETPDDGKEPETPDKPSKPQNPDDLPSKPTTPTEPDDPATPEEPSEPEEPTTPEEPNDMEGKLMQVRKRKYCANEEIYVTATGEGNAWVGIFRAEDDLSSVSSLRWYYVARSGWINGQTYGLRKSAVATASRAPYCDLPAGKYWLIYFTDDGRETASEWVQIEITSDYMLAPKAVSKMDYELSNPTDGLAAGTVKFTYDESNPVEEIVMYWADVNDKPLSGYMSLAPCKITGNGCVIELPERTLIPAEAKKLVAYSWNSAMGLSKDYCAVELPNGCQFQASGDLLSEFQIVSDIHIDNRLPAHLTHFQQFLDDVTTNSPISNGVFVNGDTANSGERYQWEWISNAITQRADAPNFYFGIGNHEYINAASGQALFLEFRNKFLQAAGVTLNTNEVYYNVKVNGYNHVFLASETPCQPDVGNGGYAELSIEQLKWFDSIMYDITTAEPNKPVFVYLHQPLYDTCAGSLPGQEWNGVHQDAELRAIMSKYKQIMFYNGHSHWVMNSYQNMYVGNDDFPNVFNTAAVGYLWTDYYVPLGVDEVGAQGYYVRVYADKLLVLARDFVSGKWIPSACYVATFDGINQ